MNEKEMVKRCQTALSEAGVDDTVIAASVFPAPGVVWWIDRRGDDRRIDHR